MIIAYLGIGSNLGNRKLHIKKAIELLKDTEGVAVKKVSSIYETEPVGGPRGQCKFLNGVIEVKTSLKPTVLLKKMQGIESVMKRTRTVKNGPRTIDLDILTYGRRVIKKPELTIPHPRLYQRDFVLHGLSQIAPKGTFHFALTHCQKTSYDRSISAL